MVFPTPAVYWLVAGCILIYVVVAIVLAPMSIHLLPLSMVKDLLRGSFGFILLVLGLPCGIYLIAWRASDLFVWLRSPESLVVDSLRLTSGDTTLAWGNVGSIVRQHNHDRLLLLHRGGKYRLRLNLWSDSDELEAEVTDRVVAALLDKVRRQVASGHSVAFGPLTLSSEGLTHKRQLIRWDDIESIRFQDGHDQGVSTRELIIAAHGRFRKIDEDKIVNAPVLLAYLTDRLEQ
ncbi:DUF6585 family protein [Myxococcus sp. CA056]|uniref:DUF6585 family protein n=1 Tax=Myxococcus sp. CA056 TaxID=2741740 RepID=UPI0020C5D1AB|nr:DUF6585 family protein [Myxococcus sp. CA056]